jgi:pilus assembly protein TadC
VDPPVAGGDAVIAPSVAGALAAAGAISGVLAVAQLGRTPASLRPPERRDPVGVDVVRHDHSLGAATSGLRRSPLVVGCVAATPALLLPFPGPLLAPVLGVLAARAPAMRARRRAAALRRSVDAEVPQLLDLLAAGSSAGLSAHLALARAGEVVRGPLGDELRAALERVELGSPWRQELGALADRLEVPDLSRAVAALTRTETLGTSLQEATVELAEAVRADRRAKVTERARTAPVKMLFPLVFLVLPAFLLLTVVPVFLSTVRSL